MLGLEVLIHVSVVVPAEGTRHRRELEASDAEAALHIYGAVRMNARHLAFVVPARCRVTPRRHRCEVEGRRTPRPYLADDLPRKRASHLSPSRSLRPRFGLRDRSDDDERDLSRRFFFERLSSLVDRLRLRLFARVTVMNFLFT